MSQRSPLHWLHVVFALSGAAALGLQLTWTRRLALGLGHEMPAAFGVVTTFFLGLAAGAWLIDFLWSKPMRPAWQCAVLEVVIGLWAVGTGWLIPWLAEESWRAVGANAGLTSQWLASFILPVLALLPATLAMGATLPAVERWAATARADHRRVAPLYGANTVGGVIGVVAAVWILQPLLGLRGATFAFAALNFICAAGFVLAGRREGTAGNGTAPAGGAAAAGVATGSSAPSRFGRGRMAVTLFATGLTGVGFEILSIRLLGQALENTVYTYASVLGVYLLATAIGAALRNRLAPDPRTAIPVLLIALPSSFAVAGLVLLGTPAWHGWMRSALGDGAVGVAVSEHVVAAAVLGLPALLMGILFSTLAEAARGRSGTIGRALGWNTLGAACAPAAVGVGLLPWVGSHWTLVILAAGYLLLLSGRLSPRHWAGVAVAVALLAGLPWDLHLQRVPPGAKLAVVREGAGDTVAVIEYADKQRALRANNRFTMGGTASANAERRHGHIPLLLHPNPKKALFLGVGTGISFASLDAHPGLEADGVELVPEIVDLHDEFAPHNEFGSDLKVRVADARRYVRASKTKYDVIIADLFHPARDGAGGLYTREHFRAVRSRLETNGVFCQWLPLFQLDLPTLRTITRSYLDVFPHTEAFLLRFNADTPVLGLVGSRQPLQFDSGWLERRTADPGLRERLKPLVLNDPWQFFGTWFANEEWLKALAGDAPINTDDRPVVIFRAPRTLMGRPVPGYALLQQLLDRPRPAVDSLFTPSTREAARPWLERLTTFQRARDQYLRGLMADAAGRASEAEAAFLESARLSVDFTSGYSQLLARATQQAKANPAGARRLLDQLNEVRPERSVARDLKVRLGL